MRLLRQLGVIALCCVALLSVAVAEPAKKVLGKLGQVKESVKIHRTASTRATTLSSAQMGQYLVVNPSQTEGWLQVVMSDGSKGFVKASAIDILPYEVTANNSNAAAPADRNARGATSTASRGASGVSATISEDAAIRAMIERSFEYIGTPYKWGGNNLWRGIDCSAFVQQMFRMIGVNLPRTAAEQARVGRPVERLEHLQPGDRLYFWERRRNMIGHTGIFLGYFADGGAYFIHSSSNNRGIATDDLRKGSWLRLLVAARRDDIPGRNR